MSYAFVGIEDFNAKFVPVLGPIFRHCRGLRLCQTLFVPALSHLPLRQIRKMAHPTPVSNLEKAQSLTWSDAFTAC